MREHRPWIELIYDDQTPFSKTTHLHRLNHRRRY